MNETPCALNSYKLRAMEMFHLHYNEVSSEHIKLIKILETVPRACMNLEHQKMIYDNTIPNSN